MRISKLFFISILLSGALLSFTTLESQSRPSGGRQGGPPPEAFTACEEQSSGSTCSVSTPQGTMSGKCVMPRGDKLVCAPEGGPKGGEGQGTRPK